MPDMEEQGQTRQQQLNSSSSSAVELERLLAVVNTQKQHIQELKQQLKEALEVQKRQRVQLVQQSPARKNVRTLLEQAAADNTLLSNRVEELRAQRNALIATKAALTAQVSELIRVAADDRQREERHRLVLQQLRHLCRLIQQPHLQQPEEQMAAVAAHVKQLYRERQELTEKLEAALRSSSNSTSNSNNNKQPKSAAGAGAGGGGDAPGHHALHPPCSSPTAAGLRLDQRATSQLIWTSDLVTAGPFQLAQQQQQQGKEQQQQQRGGKQSAAGSAGQHMRSNSCSSAVIGAGDASPAALAVGCVSADDSSFNTAESQLLDMAYISPLRGVASSSSSSNTNSHSARVHRGHHRGAAAAGDATPQSLTPASLKLPALLGTAGSAASAGAGAGAGDGDSSGTPLSAQSLSAFSGGAQCSALSKPSPRMREALQLLSPLRRCSLQRLALTPRQQEQQQQHGVDNSSASTPVQHTAGSVSVATPTSSSLRGVACTPSRGVGAAALLGSCVGSPCGDGGGPFGSSVSVASSSSKAPSVVGLSLQPEFRLAGASDSLWPSPAAKRAGSMLATRLGLVGSGGLGGAAAAAAADALGSGGSAGMISSHALWLLEEEEARDDADGDDCVGGAACCGDDEGNDVLFGGLRSEAVGDCDFFGQQECMGTSSAAAAAGCGGVEAGDAGGGGAGGGDEGRSGLLSAVVRAGVVCFAVVAAAGGGALAASTHQNRELLAIWLQGMSCAAVRLGSCAAGSVKQHLWVSRRRAKPVAAGSDVGQAEESLACQSS